MYYIARKLYEQDNVTEFLCGSKEWVTDKQSALSFLNKQAAHEYIEQNITGKFAKIVKNDVQADKLLLAPQELTPATPFKKKRK